MDILSLSTALAQDRVRQGAAVQVQKMTMDSAKLQGDALGKMLESVKAISDPALGNHINILA